MTATAPTTHVAIAAQALCRFSYQLPKHWPPGHTPVGIDESGDATCPECRELAARYHAGDDSFLPDDEERIRALQFVSDDLYRLFDARCNLEMAMRELHHELFDREPTHRLRDVAATLVGIAKKIEGKP